MSLTVETDPTVIPAPAASMSGSPAQWMVTADAFGNLWAAGGWVIQPSTPAAFEVSGAVVRADRSEALETRFGRPAAQGLAATPLDGSGTLLSATSSVAAVGLPVGAFRPSPDGYRCVNAPGSIIIDAGTAEISDGEDVVATLGSPGTPPVGTYTATSYGRTTYNSGAAFSIIVAAPEAAGNGVPDCAVSVSAGTAQTGVFSYDAGFVWVSDDDSDWEIILSADGSAILADATGTVAERAAGPDNDPAGPYVATSYGKTTYASGADFTVFIRMARVHPRAGWVWVAVATTAGIVTGATVPAFSADLPENGEGFYYVPIAYCDGSSPPQQIQSGTILWPPPSGGGEADITTKNMVILGL